MFQCFNVSLKQNACLGFLRGFYAIYGNKINLHRNLAAPAYSFLYFFIFLSLQFSNIEIFRHTFLRTVRPRRLKLGTYMDSWQMYRVYQNQAAAAYSSLYFFFFLSLQFSNIEIFHHTFLRTVRPRRLKLGTYMDSWQMYRVDRNQAAAPYSSFYFFIFLSLSFSSHFIQEL